MLTALVLGYIGPINAYLAQRAELQAEQTGLARLEARHDALDAQLSALERNDVLEGRARALGLVRPGERAFVLKLPPPESGGPAQEPSADGGILGWVTSRF